MFPNLIQLEVVEGLVFEMCLKVTLPIFIRPTVEDLNQKSDKFYKDYSDIKLCSCI
jgi:hypothetical protein